MSTELAYVRASNSDPTLVFWGESATIPLSEREQGQIQLVRDRMCSNHGWSPTDTQPLPPGIREEHVTSSIDEIGFPFGMDAPLPRGTFCTKVKFIYDNQNFIESVYVRRRGSADGALLTGAGETRIIDALHSMAHKILGQNAARQQERPTLGNIFMKQVYSLRDGPLDLLGWAPQAWFNPAYMGVFLHFVPRLFFFLGQEAVPDPSAIIDSPFIQLHMDHIDMLRLAPVVAPAEAEQPQAAAAVPAWWPPVWPALARDDGTRQEIASPSSDEEFEFGPESDEEYPMEAPLSDKDIRVRSQCSEMLQILEGVMEGGGQVNEGKYLEMCNILKELYKCE